MVALVLDGLVGFPAGLSSTSFHLSPRLGACGRVPGWLVSHFLAFVSHFFSLVSQFFSFPKQFTVRGSQCFKAWSPWCSMVWSGSRPACLPLPFICLPVLFICLPGWVIVVVGACGRLPGWLVSHFLSFVSHLGACGRVPGRLVSHFLSFVSHFFSGWVLLVRFLAGLSPPQSPFPLTMQHFYSCVSQICHWWCPPFSRWSCSISMHFFPRSVTAGVRPFPLAM